MHRFYGWCGPIWTWCAKILGWSEYCIRWKSFSVFRENLDFWRRSMTSERNWRLNVKFHPLSKFLDLFSETSSTFVHWVEAKKNLHISTLKGWHRPNNICTFWFSYFHFFLCHPSIYLSPYMTFRLITSSLMYSELELIYLIRFI